MRSRSEIEKDSEDYPAIDKVILEVLLDIRENVGTGLTVIDAPYIEQQIVPPTTSVGEPVGRKQRSGKGSSRT